MNQYKKYQRQMGMDHLAKHDDIIAKVVQLQTKMPFQKQITKMPLLGNVFA